jgi:hypothetical protein
MAGVLIWSAARSSQNSLAKINLTQRQIRIEPHRLIIVDHGLFRLALAETDRAIASALFSYLPDK